MALKIQALIPQANIAGNGLLNNAVFPFPSQRITDIPAFKIDHSVGPRMKFSYYWSQTRTASQYSPTLGGADGLPDPLSAEIGTFITARVQRANFEYTITPTLLFHFGVGYQTDYFTDDPKVTDFKPVEQLGLKGIPVDRLFPFMTGVPGGNRQRHGGLELRRTGRDEDDGADHEPPSFAVREATSNISMTWVHGNHTYKAGGELRIDSNQSTLFRYTGGRFDFSTNETALPYNQSSSIGGGTVGFAYASFLLGLVDAVTVAPVNNMKMGKHAIGMFLQDTWKITRKLTLDYGLRYDYQTYLKEQYGRFAQFAPNMPNPSAGGILGAVQFEGFGAGRCNCNFANNYPYAIGPRLGIAYQITPKTVLRGGWGIVYAATGDSNGSTAGGLSIPAAVNSPSFGQPVMTLQDGVPFAPLPFPNYDIGQFPQAGYATTQAPNTWYDQNAGRPARQMQWSLGIQREITKDLAVEASYVGNRGVWWNAPGLVDVNALTPPRPAGLNLNNPADVALLTSRLNSTTAATRGFNKATLFRLPADRHSGAVVAALPAVQQHHRLVGARWQHLVRLSAGQGHQTLFTRAAVHGLFTWAKQLSTAAPSNVTIPGTGNQAVGDVFNRSQNKYLSPFDQPFVFTSRRATRRRALRTNKVLSWVARDWQINTLLGYGSGLPILAPVAQNNLNNVCCSATPNAGFSAGGLSQTAWPGSRYSDKT